MLAIISPLRRSDASARAFMARSCVRICCRASSMAAAMNAVSDPPIREARVAARAAVKNFATANARTPASAATMAVRPSSR